MRLIMKNIPYLTIIAGVLLSIYLVSVPRYHSTSDYLLALFAFMPLVFIGLLEIRRWRDRVEFRARQFGAVDPKLGRGCAPKKGFVPPKPKPRTVAYGRPKKS